jgi:hypothetical protein
MLFLAIISNDGRIFELSPSDLLYPHPGCVGVGNNPEPLPDVVSADGTSRNTKRCRGVASTFQVK